jgi:sulfate transport system substrate-binding protein
VVAWVDANVRRHGTVLETREYLEFLFTDAAQEIIASLGYRPYKPSTARQWQPPPIALFPVTAIAHDWADAEAKFFADDGIIDTVLQEARQ